MLLSFLCFSINQLLQWMVHSLQTLLLLASMHFCFLGVSYNIFHRFAEAYTQIEKMDFDVRSKYPKMLHSQWRAVVQSSLRSIQMPVILEPATRISFYMCLALCFDVLEDEQSRACSSQPTCYINLLFFQLAALYQVVLNMFQASDKDMFVKVHVLLKFGEECVQKVSRGHIKLVLIVRRAFCCRR